MKLYSNQKGFTLVELMVVVAIIGILSSVAIPQFKQYQAKSKTSEAKLQLAALYTAEVTIMSDYDVYASCLEWIGVEVPATGYYVFGFGQDGGNGEIQAATGNGTDCPTGATNRVVEPSTIKGIGTDVAQASWVDSGVTEIDNTAQTFTAMAAGKISNKATGEAGSDKWTIDERKQVRQTQRGF